ncbi:MAG: cache domain-containing protein [Candidatus Riflebacteria bacterium]|nr:cache domain-containing protein [Candidatus Riflebacteria bacterium]
MAGIIAAIAIFFLAAWLYRFPEQLVLKQSLQEARGIVTLAVDVATRPAQQIRTALALMAKNPELRRLKSRSVLLSQKQKLQMDLSYLLDFYEPIIGRIYEDILGYEHDLNYLNELPMALLRRFAMNVGILTDSEDSVSPVGLLLPVRLDAGDIGRMVQQTRFVREKLSYLQHSLADSGTFWFELLLRIEGLVGFGQLVVADTAAVEDFFSAALNDDIFRTLMLKSLDGSVLVAAGDVAGNDLNPDARDCRAIRGGSIFFSGPVGYDMRRKMPLWWVAVPVRDENRNPVACLSAFIDAGFLSEAAEKASQKSGIKLIFAERSGAVIGHEDRQMVAQRVNLSKTMPSFASEADNGFTSRFMRHGSRLFLQAGKSVSYENVRHLPNWYVCYEKDLTQIAHESEFLLTVSVILLAATGMYVLSCCVVRLF